MTKITDKVELIGIVDDEGSVRYDSRNDSFDKNHHFRPTGKEM